MKFEGDPMPRKIGKYTCFWYNSETKEPRIAIGPDWVFSIVEILVINGICGYFLYTMDRNDHEILF